MKAVVAVSFLLFALSNDIISLKEVSGTVLIKAGNYYVSHQWRHISPAPVGDIRFCVGTCILTHRSTVAVIFNNKWKPNTPWILAYFFAMELSVVIAHRSVNKIWQIDIRMYCKMVFSGAVSNLPTDHYNQVGRLDQSMG